MKLKNIFAIAIVLVFTSCFAGNDEAISQLPLTPAPSHQKWDDLLKKHVDKTGTVDYKGFEADRKKLKEYLDLLSASTPNEKWSEKERLAFWINAYNAFTVDLILQHYPVESIKDIGSKIKIPFVSTAWDIKFIKIGGKEYDLNSIEHNVLRKEFDEPRIHFAINCASYSCPKLRNEAFTAEKLEAQLQDQTKDFVNDSRKNKISADKLELSQIFNWYKGDFTKKKTLIAYIQQFTTVKISPSAKVSYMEYNWKLNE